MGLEIATLERSAVTQTAALEIDPTSHRSRLTPNLTPNGARIASVFRFVIPDAPVAAARPRVAVRGGRPHGYMPARTAQAAWRIREHVAAQLGPDWTPLSGPLRLEVVAYLPMPASISKSRRASAQPTPRRGIWCHD